MQTVTHEEFEHGDKVKIGDWARGWYEKHNPKMLGVIMIVKYQHGDEVVTDKGWFEFDELELVEE